MVNKLAYLASVCSLKVRTLTNLRIKDIDRKVKTVSIRGAYWSNDHGPKAGKFGGPC